MEIKIIGTMIPLACGIYELDLAVQPDGHGWQFLAGVAFVVFGIVRGFYLLRQR